MLIKLRANIPEIFFGALLAVAVFAMGMIFESSRQTPADDHARRPTKEGSAPVATDHSSDKVTDWLLVLLNVFLVGSTLLLWRANNRSAKLAERALTELEAPVVGVKIIKPGLEWDLAKTRLTAGILQYAFTNYGRTPATLFELVDDVRLVKLGEGFPQHMKAERGAPMPYGVFIPPNGESGPFNCNIFAHTFGLAANEPDALKTRVQFFLGTVRYGDIFGNLYVMGFCFLFDDVGNRFIEAGGPDHSYCHKQRGPYEPP